MFYDAKVIINFELRMLNVELLLRNEEFINYEF